MEKFGIWDLGFGILALMVDASVALIFKSEIPDSKPQIVRLPCIPNPRPRSTVRHDNSSTAFAR